MVYIILELQYRRWCRIGRDHQDDDDDDDDDDDGTVVVDVTGNIIS
jgi:hypothetical protein